MVDGSLIVVLQQVPAGRWPLAVIREEAAVNDYNKFGITLRGIRLGLDYAKQAELVKRLGAVPAGSSALGSTDLSAGDAQLIKDGDERRAAFMKENPDEWWKLPEFQAAHSRWTHAVSRSPDRDQRRKAAELIRRVAVRSRGRPPKWNMPPDALRKASEEIGRYLDGLARCIESETVATVVSHFPDCDEILQYLGTSREGQCRRCDAKINTRAGTIRILGKLVGIERTQLYRLLTVGPR